MIIPGEREEAVHVSRPAAQVVERTPGIVGPNVHEHNVAHEEEAKARDNASVDKSLCLVLGNLHRALLFVQEVKFRRSAQPDQLLRGRALQLALLRDGTSGGPLVKPELLFFRPAPHGLDDHFGVGPGVFRGLLCQDERADDLLAVFGWYGHAQGDVHPRVPGQHLLYLSGVNAVRGAVRNLLEARTKQSGRRCRQGKPLIRRQTTHGQVTQPPTPKGKPSESKHPQEEHRRNGPPSRCTQPRNLASVVDNATGCSGAAQECVAVLTCSLMEYVG